MLRKEKKKMRWTPEKIVALRRAYGELQTEFHKRVGVSVTSLSMWEQGHGKPSGAAQLLLDRLEQDLAEGRNKPTKRERQPA